MDSTSSLAIATLWLTHVCADKYRVSEDGVDKRTRQVKCKWVPGKLQGCGGF